MTGSICGVKNTLMFAKTIVKTCTYAYNNIHIICMCVLYTYVYMYRNDGNIKSQQGMPNRKNTYTSLQAYL